MRYRFDKSRIWCCKSKRSIIKHIKIVDGGSISRMFVATKPVIYNRQTLRNNYSQTKEKRNRLYFILSFQDDDIGQSEALKYLAHNAKKKTFFHRFNVYL